jgi:hypothetical protein
MKSSNKNNSSNKYDPFREVLNKLNLGDNTVEIVIAVMLAVATVATAWSGYQASRWGGVQSTKYSQAGALRVESVRASNEAGQLTQIDIGLFTNWINAFAEDNNELVDFYESRFRDEFNPAFNAWLLTNPETNPDSPKSPFNMPEYRVTKAVEADKLEQEAASTFNDGKEANQQSDDYILNTVFLASVLFLSGIASKINWRPARISLVMLGILMLAVGLINVIRYPVT